MLVCARTEEAERAASAMAAVGRNMKVHRLGRLVDESGGWEEGRTGRARVNLACLLSPPNSRLKGAWKDPIIVSHIGDRCPS